MMNQEQLNVIKERVGKATQGPWEYDEEDRGIWNKGALNYLGIVKLPNNDADFIAHSREDVPILVAEVERLQKRLAQTEECYEIMEKATFKATDKMTHFKNALEKVMEVEVPIMEGWETSAYKIAQEALGGEAK
ncbi:hypothetical protein ACIQ6U_09695 [Lysinibacillus fusiformis]|uniref:hypothetical protein n=1 Tax=Lysinibacillus fusiformis TaxID=28031 RepID=UPI00382A1EC5